MNQGTSQKHLLLLKLEPNTINIVKPNLLKKYISAMFFYMYQYW